MWTKITVRRFRSMDREQMKVTLEKQQVLCLLTDL